MALSNPYPNIYRHGPANVIEPYLEAWKSPEGIRCFAAYELLKKDLRNVFNYIEPDSVNLSAYSHRTYEILLRACTEVETLCKQVFDKNQVALGDKANMIRYSDLDSPMQLHEYEILCYGFVHPPFKPFAEFANSNRSQRSPPWYRDYNQAKHNRSAKFHLANLRNVILAIGGIHALLVAQFGLGFDHIMQFSSAGMLRDTPDMFRPRELPQWPEPEQYSFDWSSIKRDSEPFQYHRLPVIP